MRQTICLIAILGLLATQAYGLYRLDRIAKDFAPGTFAGIKGGLPELKTFWAAMGKEMKTDFSSVPACYDETSAVLYWKWVDAEVAFQIAVDNSDAVAFAKTLALLNTATAKISTQLNCMNSSPGYGNLNRSMGYQNIPKDQLDNYLSANAWGQMYQNWEQYNPWVYVYLLKGDFETAGTGQGKVYFNQGYNTTHMYEQGYQAGISNGFLLNFNIPLTEELWNCWDKSSATTYNSLIHGWVDAVVNGTQMSVYKLTQDYFENTGNALLSKIESNFACEDKTQTQAYINKAIGYNIHSKEWFGMVMEYVKEKPLHYLTFFHVMNHSFKQTYMYGAGTTFGQFYKAVALLGQEKGYPTIE